jgi:hypothetical protein
MATIVLTDADVNINSVDLSAHVTSVTINYNADEVEDTAMGDTTRSRLAGLIDWSVDVEFNQDYATGAVDATLFSLVGAAAFACVFKPTSAAVSTSNPSFTGNAILTSYAPVSGSVGDLATSSASFAAAGTLTRATV